MRFAQPVIKQFRLIKMYETCPNIDNNKRQGLIHQISGCVWTLVDARRSKYLYGLFLALYIDEFPLS